MNEWYKNNEERQIRNNKLREISNTKGICGTLRALSANDISSHISIPSHTTHPFPCLLNIEIERYDAVRFFFFLQSLEPYAA
ncbi:hypothetical protein [Paenibacillus sp. Y412MC10]|uniref:hypothetical protein n=1 Tax=Geobacillus sp. (strain Y412MC10) TaxID=481743 RepID=UPI0011A91F07|nr:hypothetical protein [Paenibacillus sp. Y412MC10]